MMLKIVVALACLASALGFSLGGAPKVARNVKIATLQMSTPDAPAGKYNRCRTVEIPSVANTGSKTKLPLSCLRYFQLCLKEHDYLSYNICFA
jgi:hypothetical protein